MATERIDIQIREDGSRVVRRNIEDIGEQANRTDKLVGKLKTGLAVLVSGGVLNQMRQMADQYTLIQNQLRLTTNDQANLNAVFDELQGISMRTRSSLEANVEMYSRLSLTVRELGISQKEVLQFTESLNKTIKISGASATEAEAGIRQLSQGLASGTLRGEEMNSVLENTPAVADVIAKGMGVTRGELRELGSQGKVTALEVLNAFRQAREEIDGKFNKTLPTSAEGLQMIKDQLLVTVGAISEATGASEWLGKAFAGIASWLKKMTPEFVAVTRAIMGTLDPMDEMSSGAKVAATIFIVLINTLKVLGQIVVGVVIGAFQNAGRIIGAVAAAVRQAIDGDFSGAFQTIKQGATDVKNNTVKNFGDIRTGVIDTTSNMFTELDQLWNKSARNIQDRSKELRGEIDKSTKDVKPAGPSADDLKKQQKELEASKKAFEQLRNQLDPIAAATIEMSAAEDVLSAARKRGQIDAQEEARLLAELHRQYADILNPMNEFNRFLEEETKLLGMSADARQREATIMQLQQDMLSKGKALTEEEVVAIRQKLTTLDELAKVTEAQDSLLSGSVKKREEFATQLLAIQNLLANPASGFTAGDAASTASSMISAMGLDPELTQVGIDAQLEQFRNMYSQIDQMRQANLISEQDAERLRAQVALEVNAQRLQHAQDFFGNLATLSNSGNKKLAAIGKAAAITQATIQGFLAVQNALAVQPYPVGVALAASAGIAAAANVAKIAGVGLMTGGEFTVGGSGGADSQMVAIRATPGERVTVATPTQVRKGTAAVNGTGSDGGAKPQVNLTVVNVVDESLVDNYMNDPNTDQVFVNKISSNARAVKNVVENA